MLGIDATAARRAWSAILVLLLVLGIFAIRYTLLVFIVAILFAYLLCPLVEFNQRRIFPRSRTMAALFPFAVFIITVTAAAVIVHPQFVKERDQLFAQVSSPQFKQHLQEWSFDGIPVGRLIFTNYGTLLTMLPKDKLGDSLHTTIRDAGSLILVPILAFFFLRDGRHIRDTLVALLYGSERSTPLVRKGKTVCISLLCDAHALILDYMRALLLQCACTFVACAVFLTLLHVPYAILLALIAFPLEFVPLVGPLISATLILAVCEFSLAVNPASVPHLHIAWVIAFLAVYRVFTDYVLSPIIMRRGVQLHPLLIIFGVYAGGELGGVGGIFLSVPLLALARLVFFEWRKPVPVVEVEEMVLAPDVDPELDAVG
ncbi:MAG TPA: AI-2E family transporter [Acidobacteriaceae bacterium]|nr:AI-2E family transporter [Acidobacteriaceae bacterium]